MALRLEGVGVRVGEKKVLQDVNLEVKEGEVVALMGPNGSGKSSLAYAVMGHPRYRVVEGEVSLDGEDLLEMPADERAKRGLFIAFQYPVGVEGVRVRELLLAALRERGEGMEALEIKERLEGEAEELGIDKELLDRGLNFDFSGGEKKKMEILQLKLLEPKYAILDETDSGLDIDALREVARVARRVAEQGTGLLVITHYRRILEYLEPDRVVVLKEGKVVEKGGRKLVERLEKEGYKNLEGRNE